MQVVVDRKLADTGWVVRSFFVVQLPPDAVGDAHSSSGVAAAAAVDTAAATAVACALVAVASRPPAVAVVAAAVLVSSALPTVPLSGGTTCGRGFPPAKIPSSAYRWPGPDRRLLSGSSTSGWPRTVLPDTAERPTVRDWNELPGRSSPVTGFRSVPCRSFLRVVLRVPPPACNR